MSVTYGAGGSTRGPTRDWVRKIPRRLRVEAMPHLTCVAHTRDEIAAIIQDYQADGVDTSSPSAATCPRTPKRPPRPSTPPPNSPASSASAPTGTSPSPPTQRATHGRLRRGRPQAPGRQARPGRLRHHPVRLPSPLLRTIRRPARRPRRRHPGHPGIMPPTNVAGIERMSALNATEFPTEIRERLEQARTPADRGKSASKSPSTSDKSSSTSALPACTSTL